MPRRPARTATSPTPASSTGRVSTPSTSTPSAWMRVAHSWRCWTAPPGAGCASTSATEVGFVEMRIAKVVGLGAAEDEIFPCVVLDEVAGDRHLPILIGQAEAFSLSARLGGVAWHRPMTYQLTAALVQALGGRVRQVRIDRLVEEAYAFQDHAGAG